jgi:hypothetical protein
MKESTGTASLTIKEGPCQSGTVNGSALGNHSAVADCSAGLVQCVAKDGQEHDRGDNTLEGKEVLNL